MEGRDIVAESRPSHRGPAAARALLVLALLLGLGLAACGAPQRRYEFARPKMGTTFRLVFYAGSEERAQRAADAAFARVDELNAILSDYDPDSELSRLCARSDDGPTGPLAVTADLARALALARDWAQRTGGAFDPTVGPFVRLWRRSARQGELPAPERLAAAARAVGYEHFTVDARAGTVRLGAARMALDLGGIGKGYALDECLRVLAQHGVRAALVDGGGDVACGAPPPGRRGWRVVLDPRAEGPDRPPAALELARAAVATSGDAYRFVVIDGARYSHVIDPRTGLGLTEPVAACVVAADGTTADALATAACVLGADQGLALLAALAGVEGRIVTAGARTAETPGFASLAAGAE